MNSESLGYLVSHKEVYDFLLNYPRDEWPQVLLSTLVYGISSLKSINLTPPPLIVIQSYTKKAGFLAEANSAVPTLKSKLKQIQGQIDDIEDALNDKFLFVNPPVNQKVLKRDTSTIVSPFRSAHERENPGYFHPSRDSDHSYLASENRYPHREHKDPFDNRELYQFYHT